MPAAEMQWAFFFGVVGKCDQRTGQLCFSFGACLAWSSSPPKEMINNVNLEICTKNYVEKYVDFVENSTCVFQKSVVYLAS